MTTIAFVIDPIETFHLEKDSTIAMMRAAQKRNWEMSVMQPQDLYVERGVAMAKSQSLTLTNTTPNWYELSPSKTITLGNLDYIFMRKDPPFDMDFIYSTYILELALQQGAQVINHPQSLRDTNEKMFINWFPQCITDTLVSANITQLKDFLHQQKDVIVKPLDGMGGASIFRLQEDSPNIAVTLDLMTDFGKRLIMAQRYLPEIKQGDKRILLINGEPIPYALARIPAEGETRANLAAGGTGKAVPLTERDHWLCQQVGAVLKYKGLQFVGLDVIGDYITEINVTSPTCIRQLDEQCGLDIAGALLDSLT